MKRLLSTLLLATTMMSWSLAHAAAINERVLYQGYIRQSGGGAFPNSTYNLAIVVNKNGAPIWGKAYALQAVDNGIFNIVMSGNGSNLIAAGYANYAAVPFDSSLIGNTILTDTLSVDVLVDINGDLTYDETFTGIELYASPTAMVAQTCNAAAQDAVNTAAIQDGSVTFAKLDGTASANGDVMQFVGGAWTSAPFTTSISQSGAASFSTGTGAVTLNGPTTVASGVDMSAAGGASDFNFSASTGTFDTTTGAVNLNGNTTVTGAKTFTTGTGAVNINGQMNIASGVDIIAAGGASDIDFSLSSGVTSTGSGAVGLNGDVTIAGAKTFTTGTGAVSLNGDVTIAGAKAFTTGSGTTTLNGLVIPASGVDVIAAGGASDFDYALSSGITSTGTGAVSLNGDTTIATAKGYAATASSMVLAGGSNNNIAATGTYFRVTGPVAGFNLTGLSGGVSGKMIQIENTVAKPMGFALNSGLSLAANRITGRGCILTQYGVATLVYDATVSLWVITACELGSAPVKTISVAASTTYNAAGPLVTDGASVLMINPTGAFTITTQCIAMDATNQITPIVGQVLTIVWNSNASGTAASNSTISHNIACGANSYNIKTSTAAAVAGTAANNGVIQELVFDGTEWVLRGNNL